MKANQLPLILCICITATTPAQQQTAWQWIKPFGSQFYDTQNNNDEEIVAMEVDDQGNVYVAGNVWGDVTVDSTTYPSPTGQQKGFLAKFDCRGALQWFDVLNSSVRDMTSLYSGLFYVATGSQILKIDSLGNTTVFFQGNFSRIRMAIDHTGHVYTLSFGFAGTSYGSNHQYGNLDTTYLAKHDSIGNVILFKPIVNSYAAGNFLISSSTYFNVNSSKEFFIAGTTRPYGAFHAIGGDTVDATATHSEGFVIKLDSNANFTWCKKTTGGGGCALSTLIATIMI